MRRDFNGFGVAFVTRGFVGKQGSKEFWLVECGTFWQGWIRLACQAGDGFNLQTQFVSDWLEAVGLLIDHVGELLGHLGEFLAGLLAFDLVNDVVFDFGHAAGCSWLDRSQANDVVTEIGLDQVADLAFFQFVSGVFEWLDHHALAKEIEVAAPFGRSWVL